MPNLQPLFKYFPIDYNFLNSLEHAKLWFSDPLFFGDPYDCNLSLYIDVDKEVISDHFTKLNNHFKQMGKKFLDDEALQDRINYLSENPNILREHADKQIKNHINNIGVCCFSKRDDKLLMWSHYADKHKGICVKFEPNRDIPFFYLPYEVHYPPKFPQFNYLRETNKLFEGKHSGLMQHLLATKSQEWNYEQEVRVVKEKIHGNYRGLIEFNKQALSEVIFGYKVDESKISSIKKVLKSNGYRVEIYKMELISDDFGLDKIKI